MLCFLEKFKWEDFVLFGISSKAREQSDQVLCLKERFEFVRPLSWALQSFWVTEIHTLIYLFILLAAGLLILLWHKALS